ncbi:MAG TPA: SDR family oxidoreductase [Caulobacteraceae bacterium]|jgi:hypothetical protein
MTDAATLRDPQEQGAKPPFPEQEQNLPGLEQEMDPRPDYGVESYKGSGKLQGRRALITGGDSGIGRAVALAFAREGADVAISYLPQEEADAAETAQIVEAEGRKCLRLPGDIQDQGKCRELVERTVGELGGLDILVNNAAFQDTHPEFTEISAEELEKTFRTNFHAMFWLCQAAVPHMKPGASILNTTSVQAYKPKSHLIHYASTKAAIRAFTQALAQELAEKGIRVNGVAPGPIWTPLIPASFPGEKVKEFGKQTPLGRAGQPKEVAPVFVFLASDDASYVTGQIYGVTGGEPTA